MRTRHKKILLSGAAVTVAGILGVGTLLQTSVSVQASSAMMPGIEEIVNETSKDKPFRILEIVDSESEAEIGYYVSGQEPYIKLYRDENGNLMNFSGLEDGLSKLPADKREEFATNKKTDENGNISTTGKDIETLCGESEENNPLAYSGYQERYFVSSEDGWKRVDFVDADGNSRTDIVKVKGHYQENAAGNGDYTKQEQTYYPIRKDIQEDNEKTDKYRENIENFYYSDDEQAQAPYTLTFAEVDNEKVNTALEDANDKGQVTILPEYDYSNGKYGYYENVYADLTENIANNIQNRVYNFPGENPVVDEDRAVLLQDNTPKDASAFSAGEEGEFTTVNDGSEIPDVVVQNDFAGDMPAASAGDDFSTGDFSDGVSDDDIQEQTQQDVPQVDEQTEQLTDNADTEEKGVKVRTILIGFADEATKGTTENPYIYLGESIQAYPYYKYTLVGDLKKIQALAQENQNKDADSVANNQGIIRTKTDVTLEDGQYWYWKIDTASGQLTKYPLSIVTGRQAVSYSYIKKIDDSLDYNYYYTVQKAYFCCEAKPDAQLPADYQYYGWYYSSYPRNGADTYIKITDGDGKTATHYISDAEYKLTPGIGNFDFIPNEEEEEQNVEVNHMYYKGGYVNHDWFKRYVFHLPPESSDETVTDSFKAFNMEVVTMTAADFNQTYGNSAAAASANETEEAAFTSDSGENNTDIFSDSAIQESNETDISEPENTENVQGEEQPDNNGETSEVAPVVSEAGIELVSIEKEINDEVAVNFQDGASDDVSAFSAGETPVATDVHNELSNYDLIYVNGIVTSGAVQAMGSIPVIVNSVKAESSEDLRDAFSAYIKAADGDKHYVNKMVYFFRNTFSEENPSGLINTNFDTNYNLEAEGKIFTDANATEGFEEILEYIESENQYRKLGKTENSEDDSLDISDGKIELLSNKISQARAIEYIINYQYKRNLLTKDEINVLEIEPAKSSGYLSEEIVNSWLGNAERDTDFIQSYSVCCAYDKVAATHKEYAPASNMFDGNSSTIWHSDWGEYLQGHPDNQNHYINVTFNKAMTITGFDYLPREGNSDGAKNGKVKDFILHVYSDENCETEQYSEGDSFEYTNLSSDHQLKKFRFANGKSVSDVKSVKIEIVSAGDNLAPAPEYLSKRYASCAELSFSTKSEAWTPEINIDVMTASEYVGHIDDINSKYDLIYIGKDDSGRNDLINGVSPMLYTHVGAAVNVNDIHDTSNGNNIKKLSLMGMLDIDYVNPAGKKMMQDTRLYNTGENGETQYPGLGSFRGSGNDITKQQYEELMDFVKSGYPVILADSLVDNGLPSTETVDNSSYYYRFIKDALSYSNVSTMNNLKNMNLSFFTKLSKPVIEFTDNGKPLEVPRVGEIESTSSGIGYLTGENLRYEFFVKNDSEAYPANTTYNCELFFDLNFDGNLSRLEEQDKYMEIQDETGNVLVKTNGVYQLKINHKYIVTRKIPEDYFKVITWKLQLTSNANSSVRTSVMGYAKRKKNSKQTINVLQIIPTKPSGGDSQLVTWNLYDEWKKNSTFYRLMNAVEDFTLDIKTVTVTAYENDTSVLDDRQILILGFGDVYENIKNDEGQVDKIVKFIQDGKSVIFTHDTTSNMNWNYKEFTSESDPESDPVTVDGRAIKDEYLWRGNVNRKDWGYSLNTLFRTISGLDRYGITNTKETSVKDGSTFISALLKQGNMLNASDATVDFSYMEQMAGDVAYVTNSNRTQSYMQTQGYVNKEISKIKSGQTVNETTKVNDGVITEYPYKLPDNLTVAGTHGQYYQLSLEKDRDINGVSDGKNDIVVWYCLSGDYYNNSPNDVRNNYYFYSRGNVIYTGVGHSKVTGESEIELFINAIVAAANVTAVKPEVNFVTELKPTAKVEKTRYYATDQTSWNQDEINVLKNDQDFFINVKDYNMISSSLSLEDQSKEDMTVDFYIGGTEEDNKINNVIRWMIPYGNNAEPVKLSTDGSFHVKNNAYGITLSDIERYLRDDAGGYLQNCKLYVKVTSTVSLYGKNVTNVSESSVDLKQRQLFDLD